MVDLSARVENMRSHFADLEKEMSDPEIFNDRQRYTEISREHQRLSSLLKCSDQLSEVRQGIIDNKEMISEETDEEMIEMARMELSDLEEKLPLLEAELKQLIVPPDPNDSRNSIVEIRPAAGGDEAALFAEELQRMYTNYANSKGWKTEMIEYTANDIGGIKSCSFLVKGDDVYKEFFYESGVHRVQRIPATESQGRVHTSTVTVAVMPEAEEVELQLDEKDLRFDVYRSSGAGGQCVNTTDSAVRVTHIPTGIFVASQQERSQHRNREIAVKLLASRLLEEEVRKEKARLANLRQGQIGTGDRSERIRTYNFPQNRITDHRYGITTYSLPQVMTGELADIMNQILTIEADRRLENELS